MRAPASFVSLVVAALLLAPLARADDASRAPIASPSRWVHVNADSDVQLEVLDAETNRWTFVCNAPCDRVLPLAPRYRVTGESLRPSTGMHLVPLADEHVVLDVDGTSASAHAAGLGLTVGGGIAAGAGVLLLFGGLFLDLGENGIGDDNGAAMVRQDPTGGRVAEAGLVTLGVGVLALAVGGPLLYATRKPTHVTQEHVDPESGPFEPGDDRWQRVPTGTFGLGASMPLPRTVSVPILARSF